MERKWTFVVVDITRIIEVATFVAVAVAVSVSVSVSVSVVEIKG